MLEFLKSDDSSQSHTLSKSVAHLATSRLAGVTEYRAEDFDKMAELGLTSIGIRPECKGIALDGISAAAVLYEIAKVNLGPAVYLSVHQMVSRLINAWGKNDLHLEVLEKLACGKSLGAFCLTEAGAGSDASALSLKASKNSDGFILNGEKVYISSAPHADVFLVFARSDSSPDDSAGKNNDSRKTISCFVVDARTKGITIGPAEKKMGCEASPIASVHFDKCNIPKQSLLGEIGQGYSIALSGLNKGRISIAAAACGISTAALAKAKEHLNTRKQFGKHLAEFQGLQFIFADMLMAHRAAILLTRDAAEQIDKSPNDSTPASIAKCFASDVAMKNSTEAVQLLGGAGYLAEYGVERLMRDAKMLQIVEGTNQIQRLLIARYLKQ